MIVLWTDLLRQAIPSGAGPSPRSAELTSHQLHVLGTIAGQGPMSMAQLAKVLQVTESAATVVEDDLVSSGATSRQRDPRDRRVVYVIVTEPGTWHAATHRRDLAAELCQLLNQLETAEVDLFSMAFSQRGKQITEVLSGARCGHPPGSGTS